MGRAVPAITTLLFLTGFSALAESPTEDIRNLIYYAHANRFTVSGSINTAFNNATDETQNGVGTYQAHSAFVRETVSGTYGLTDTWRVGISEGYESYESTSSTDPVSGKVTSTNASGFSNPTLSVTARMLQSEGSNWYGDVQFLISPQLGPAIRSSTTQDGNYRNGFWSAGWSASFFYASGWNEAGIIPNLTLNFSGTSDSDVKSGVEHVGPKTTGGVNLEDRMHLSDTFFLQGTLELHFGYSYTYSYEGSPGDRTANIPFYTIPHIQAGYGPNARWEFLADIYYASYSPTYEFAPSPTIDSTFREAVATITARTQF